MTDHTDDAKPHDPVPPDPPRPSFGADLFLGRHRPELLRMASGSLSRLSDDEESFLDRLRRFCEKEVDAALIERQDRVPDEVIEGLKDLGAFCIRIPQRYGGLGLSVVCYYRALMIVSSVHSALSELLAAHQAIGLPQPILLFGTEQQKRELLPRCAREISAFALTEPDIGNDPYRIHTTATYDPVSHAYTLDGVKLWVTNGVIADLLVVLADVPHGEHGPGGMTAFVVEADAAGVTVEHRSSFLGLRGLENGVIRLDQVVVDAGSRIGDEGQGLEIALRAQETGRLSLPAVNAAAAKWSVRIAREWAGVRVQWGRPIGEHDAVAGKLSFLAATAFALEAMVEVTGRQQADGHTETGFDAELAKLFASEKAWLVADELMQIRGGRGYETAASAAARGERAIPVEQLMRDARIGRIFDGSSEALRMFLAQAVIDSRSGDVGYPETRVADDDPVSDDGDRGTLAGHLHFVDDTARRLARELDLTMTWSGVERDERQRHLGRIIDIGAELYAMSVSCAYAEARAEVLGEAAVDLADAFCAQARIRVQQLFELLSTNTDARDRAVARRLLDGRYTWLEEGVLDPSVDGPWIAAPERGATTGGNLRRHCPSRPDRDVSVPGDEGRSQVGDEVALLLRSARQQISEQSQRNRFLDLLCEGRVPVERLRWLAGELYHLVRSDRRSFALLASRFSYAPAGELFLAMAGGEDEAMRLLLDFAAALDMGEDDLERYEPKPLAQAYPAYLAQVAMFGTRSDIALALLANVEESGGNYLRAIDGLQERYGLSEEALGHFRYFADTPQEVLDQAAATLRAGLADGDDPVGAVRTARLVHAFEAAFWDTLADGIGA